MKTITLATLKDATEQEVFTQVVTHMLTQNEKCQTKGENTNIMYCNYRNDKGLKCAAGCLISDDEYSNELEGGNWSALVTCEKVPSTHEDLILELQQVHDQYKVKDWKLKLSLIAKQYGLEMPQIKT